MLIIDICHVIFLFLKIWSRIFLLVGSFLRHLICNEDVFSLWLLVWWYIWGHHHVFSIEICILDTKRIIKVVIVRHSVLWQFFKFRISIELRIFVVVLGWFVCISWILIYLLNNIPALISKFLVKKWTAKRLVGIRIWRLLM